MISFNPFDLQGKWFKGNLHCHSTNSDGRLSPAEVARIYKRNGWDFLAFTEHGRYTNNTEFNDENFLIIPGAELDTAEGDPFRIYHIVGIKGPESDCECMQNELPNSPVDGRKKAQALIDSLTEKGNLAIFCHPIWSRLEYQDFNELTGFFAMEVFNYGCSLENHTGLCTDYWDSFLRRGIKVWGVASDDAHHNLNDQCGGWVMVKALELTHKSIVDALVKGSFYSSSGPEVYEYRIEDNEVYVECSPVHAIHFVTYENWGLSCWAEADNTICSARYKLSGNETYVRVECVDKSGKVAWTNPIFIK